MWLSGTSVSLLSMASTRASWIKTYCSWQNSDNEEHYCRFSLYVSTYKSTFFHWQTKKVLPNGGEGPTEECSLVPQEIRCRKGGSQDRTQLPSLLLMDWHLGEGDEAVLSLRPSFKPVTLFHILHEDFAGFSTSPGSSSVHSHPPIS